MTQPISFEDTREVESEVKNMLMQATNKVNSEERSVESMVGKTLKKKHGNKALKQINLQLNQEEEYEMPAPFNADNFNEAIQLKVEEEEEDEDEAPQAFVEKSADNFGE